MVHAHVSQRLFEGLKARPGGEGVDLSLTATLDALDTPTAVLDDLGAVVVVNAAWQAMTAEAEAEFRGCHCGESYFAFCRALADEISGALLRSRVRSLIAGRQDQFEATCQVARGGLRRLLRIHVQRVGDALPRRFIVTHRELEPPPLVDTIEERIASAQAGERERFAADLHDSVGQHLVCLGLSLSQLRLSQYPELSAVVRDMTESLAEAQKEVRTLSYAMYLPGRQRGGFGEQAVREFVSGFARRAGLTASVEVKGFPCALDRARELALFRVLQEAMVNVHRHAHAGSVHVQLHHRRGKVKLVVKDDGGGFVRGARRSGVGLMAMRARMALLGGGLRVSSGPDGATVTAELPLPSPKGAGLLHDRGLAGAVLQ